MYNEICTLIEKTSTTSVDEYGDTVYQETEKICFCKVNSIGTSEFYQAQTAGVKPEIKLVLADYYDYSGQQEVIFNGYRYKVLRTYRTNTNTLELTLYGGVRIGCS